MDWQTMIGISAVVAALTAVGTLIYAVRSGRKQAGKLATQTKSISEQTELLRKQVFCEVYDEAQIKNLQFFLPEGRKCPAMGFKDIQKENEEIRLGKEAKLQKGKETDLHIQFWIGAPQRLRFISCGFPDSLDGTPHKYHPSIINYKKAFIVKELSHFEREITQDWHGHWRMEFPFPRFLPKGECYVLCLTVIGNDAGKFPLALEISTEEAKNSFRENLWVEVTS